MAQQRDARVWNVKIEGNQAFEDMVIKNRIANKNVPVFKKMLFWRKTGMALDENEVKRDAIRIQRFYNRRGFPEVEVSYRIEEQSKAWRKNVIFEITENEPVRVAEINHTIHASGADSSFIYERGNYQRLLNRLHYKVNGRYEPVENPTAEALLESALNNLGFAYANTQVKAQVDTLQKTAIIDIISNPGPRTTFDSILVEGADKLDERYIIRETGIKRGDYYSEGALRQAQREVFNHHMLRYALLSIPEQEKDSTLNLLIRVRENPVRAFEMMFGIGNLTRIDGGDDAYKLFRGQIGWTHRNVRGKGERFNITGRASAIEQRIGGQYLFPYLFNTKSSVSFSPYLQHKLEPAYEILRWGLISSLAYQYNQSLAGALSYEFSINEEFTDNANRSLPDSIISYNVSSFQVNGYYAYNFRDGNRGWMFRPSVELSGLFGETTYSFQKSSGDIRKFTKLTDAIVLAKRMYFSGIYYSVQDSLPSDIMLYNGGTNAVRGWNRLELGPKRPILEEDGSFSHYVPVGGRATFNFNAELRIELNNLIKGFGFATFLDGGQVWRNFKDIGTTGLQFGLGGGFRYQSPIGPLRIDIARKLNPTDEDLNIYQNRNYGSPWNYWGIHFSIGQAF